MSNQWHTMDSKTNIKYKFQVAEHYNTKIYFTCWDWTVSNKLYSNVWLGCEQNISNLSNTIIIDFEAVLFPARKLSNKKLRLSK